ncbi:hypothetical protein CRD17_10275 [Corynebacterium sp. LK30]|uniref:hypothetical protein n=1 Tax=unclassified Corynebacterium TaxID=2624378 RepID=UPI0008A4226F|nr:MULTISPECIES: hypothetical protein [unclassified Corynebacterium]MBC6807583.1 hypothetical protein [Corynebacterium sp. LK30]OFN08576.1 hypothetical protein HMPREF2614_06065 [Corynebacterium sp. HMSC074C11]
MTNLFESMQQSAQRLQRAQVQYEEAAHAYEVAREQLDEQRAEIKSYRSDRVAELRERQRQEMTALRDEINATEAETLTEPQAAVDSAAAQHNHALDAWRAQLDTELETKVFTHAHLDAMGLDRPSSHRPVKVRSQSGADRADDSSDGEGGEHSEAA